MWDSLSKLRKEISGNSSGNLHRESLIPILKEEHYHVKTFKLDGDAPKEFIRAYFYEEDSPVRKATPKTWPLYIAKTAEKWYPHESVIEFMINKIGQILGLEMNNIKLVKANGQIRFLSQYFLKPDERLIHGAEICGQHLEDLPLALQIANDAKAARDLFTFQFISEAIKEIFPTVHEQLLIGLVKMITFDAITGNNDRHFYNWGVIDSTKKTNIPPRFSPIFDSARGIFWNWSDKNLRVQKDAASQNGKKIEKYIEEAKPRISLETNKIANHFQLVEFLKNDNAIYGKLIDDLSSKKNESSILKMLEIEFFPFFCEERKYMITYLLSKRFEKIRRL